METADRLELHELPGRYGDAIDDRDWDRLDQIFTPDAIFDLTDLGSEYLDGLDAIKEFMDLRAVHPKTHLMTNIYVDPVPGGAQMFFRIVAMQSGGRMATASYYDNVVQTPNGWRVAHRVITSRRRGG